ncbi:MAG: hypothetical protein AB1453_00385 [Chloroflexota bacterium]
MAELLTEAYDKPIQPSATWFIDNQPDSGVLGVLKGISAVEASVSVDGSRNAGTTIASHAMHLCWSLANVNATIRGEPWNPNWSQSWALQSVDEGEWDQLRQELRREFETLRDAIQKQESLEGDYLTGLLALAPHAAYHLATIRQMLERVRMPSAED